MKKFKVVAIEKLNPKQKRTPVIRTATVETIDENSAWGVAKASFKGYTIDSVTEEKEEVKVNTKEEKIQCEGESSDGEQEQV